jgi:hypothetical protein
MPDAVWCLNDDLAGGADGRLALNAVSPRETAGMRRLEKREWRIRCSRKNQCGRRW